MTDDECPHCEAVKAARGWCTPKEAGARAKIIYRIIRAKREAGFPRDCDFFRDVWPVALAALAERDALAARLAEAMRLLEFAEANGTCVEFFEDLEKLRLTDPDRVQPGNEQSQKP